MSRAMVRAAAVLRDEVGMFGRLLAILALMLAVWIGALALELWFWDWYCGGEVCGAMIPYSTPP